MRRTTIFLLALLILTACSSLSIATPTATAALPSPSPEPTKTLEPTKTPEPTATPDPRFKELMPETWQKCMEENVINWETRDADLALLLKRIKENPLDPEQVPMLGEPFIFSAPRENSKSTPVIITYWQNYNGALVSACAALKMPDSRKLPVFVFPVKRAGSNSPNYLFCVSDREAYLISKGDPITNINDTQMSEIYLKMKNTSLVSISEGIILKRSPYPKTNEIWKNLLSLIPEDSPKAEEYYQNLIQYFGQEPLSEEKMKTLGSYISNRFLPCMELGYTYQN